jgi:PAS domain S-box-containing protein
VIRPHTEAPAVGAKRPRTRLDAASASDARYRGLLEAAPDAMVVVDHDGCIVLVNVQAEKRFGYHRDELLGQPVADIIPEGFAERLIADDLRSAADALDQQIGTGIELVGRRKDGSSFPIEIMLSPLASAGGVLVTAAIRDITVRRAAEAELLEKVEALHRSSQELEQLEDQLRQAHKMEALGQVTGGVAHDFSNLLTVILGHANLMVEQLAEQDPIRESAEEIRDAADRAAAMTRQLLAFSRRQVLEPGILDLAEVLGGLARLLRRLTGEGIELVLEPPPEPAHVLADASQVTQVLMNLALNARDAMPGGGSLTITLGEAGDDDRRPTGMTGLPAGRYVTLTVRDTGVGMDADTRAHLFEPFFTTKDRDKGTGLGLATAYGIVRQSGGDIAVRSELGNGATFTIYLPWHDGSQPASGGPPAAPARVAQRPTVLLVDNEKAVRLLARRVLERDGYVVLEAADAEDALAIARDHAKPIDLLLADVVMPRLDGRELARQVREVRPEVAVVLMAGLPDDPPGSATGRIRYVQKPFTAGHLVAKLREAMALPMPDLPDPAQARAIPSSRENSVRTRP